MFFYDEIFAVEPLSGRIWAKSKIAITFTFTPKVLPAGMNGLTKGIRRFFFQFLTQNSLKDLRINMIKCPVIGSTWFNCST